MNKILTILFILFSIASSGQSARRLLLAQSGGVTPVQPSSPISCWNLDEALGASTAVDNCGANDLANTNITAGVTGKVNTAYSFGTTSQLDLAAASDFEGLSAVSVSAWVYGTSNSTANEYAIIVSKLNSTWASPYYQFQLRILRGAYQKYEFVVGTSSVFGGPIIANNTYVYNTWQYVVATWDGATGIGKIYINGVDATISDTSPTGTTNTASTNLVIGDDTDLLATFKNWAGKIDQPEVYDFALSEAEVLWLYNSGSGRACDCATVPTVTTTSITGIDEVEASSGGNVTSDGGATVTARGVCWNTTGTPTTADSKTINGTGTGAFTSAIVGSVLNTLYYVRAYATNSEGTAYGSQTSFTTGNPTLYTFTHPQGFVFLVTGLVTAKGTSTVVDDAYAIINPGGGGVVGTEVFYVSSLTISTGDYIYDSSDAVETHNYFQLFRSTSDTYSKLEYVNGKITKTDY